MSGHHKRLRVLPAVVAVLVLGAAAGFVLFGRAAWFPVCLRVAGRRSVEQVMARYGPAAEGRLRPYFERRGAGLPPAAVVLLGFKQEQRLELWAAKGDGWVHIRDYPILAASGHAGPKLREGDRQVPEGVYRVADLNPNSRYHLSMKLDYPNERDREQARADGRTGLGGEIFIHGADVSIGCIAVGDEAIEELFCLVATVGFRNVQVILAPNDLRGGAPATAHPGNPGWVPQLYEEIRSALAPFSLSRQ